MTWVLIVIYFGVEQPRVKFDDVVLCLKYARALTAQSYYVAKAGEELPVQSYCIPQPSKK
tara:strand:+ start:109 stop:288 length:180 start_codon:yes stop_codon:yes gene_type:complete